ncbi:hypothetical protein G9272_32340 [Streptomyces asoensis]|uniref:Uncharacterized protein n=1 Tax=Streptomyces asoensis TaxID=249586 RepID=A0A6M4WW01_9ACTN|nr:hypothetical protein [Streptomyces asoensis]QJT04408.1 hypothetical protein G9272_32340 [Streptomyces asoensis]
MKKTYRDDWRVIVTIAPQATHIPISALGFEGLDGELAGLPFDIEIAPRPLGDLGGVYVSDRLASRDIDGDYRRRCEELLAELLKRPHVKAGRVTCKETHVCSHCDLGWEVLTADDAFDERMVQDEHSVEGEPVCCEAAIAEFRAERGIPALAEGGAA